MLPALNLSITVAERDRFFGSFRIPVTGLFAGHFATGGFNRLSVGDYLSIERSPRLEATKIECHP
jgi:hypothetical protein